MWCKCPCDGCAVGRVWYTPDHAELDTYEPPDTPYDEQGDMGEQAEDMDDEWGVYHQLLQDQDNFDPATGEDGTARPAERGRACARVYRPSTDLATELAVLVLVQAADRLPAGHKGSDGYRVTS